MDLLYQTETYRSTGARQRSDCERGGPSISVRTLLFAGVFVLALALRVGELGAMPLNDGEAAEALWAAVGTPEQRSGRRTVPWRRRALSINRSPG
jgi:hypothetical protein